MLAGALQELPLKVSALPSSSTAAQNEDDGHDTDSSEPSPSMLPGALQELPLKVSSCPYLPTAAQNEDDGHDTDVSRFWPSMLPERSRSCR